jgi:phenylacetate-CoA ligase
VPASHAFPPPIPHSQVEGIAWPALAGGTQPLMLATLLQLEQSQWLSPAELRQRQYRQVEKLLAHVEKAMPFYRPALDACGWRAGRPLDDDLWAALPILTRRQVQEAATALHCRTIPPQHGEIVEDTTSGSLGMPLKVLKTALEQFFWNVFTLREELWHARDLAGKFAAIRHDRDRPADARGVHARRFETWGSPVAAVYPTGPAVMLDNRCSVAEQAEWLRQEAPDYLLSFGVNLLFLARHCRDTGLKLPSLRGLRSSGMVLSTETREICREVFGLEIVDMYSAVETGYIALQCPEHPHYHVQAENTLVEVLDADGRLCRPGEIGRVVVTPLHNFAMPLLRYAIGDHAEVGEPCPCGRGLPVLRRILGRTRDMLLLPNGDRRFPEYGQKALANLSALIQHQVVQTSLEDIEVRLVVRQRLSESEEAELRATMLRALEHPFRIAFVYRDELPGGAGGKFDEFRCEVMVNNN